MCGRGRLCVLRMYACSFYWCCSKCICVLCQWVYVHMWVCVVLEILLISIFFCSLFYLGNTVPTFLRYTKGISIHVQFFGWEKQHYSCIVCIFVLFMGFPIMRFTWLLLLVLLVFKWLCWCVLFSSCRQYAWSFHSIKRRGAEVDRQKLWGMNWFFEKSLWTCGGGT